MNSLKHTKKDLIYLTLRDFPRRVANRVQTLKMAEALSEYFNVTLTVSKLHVSNENLFNYYGIKNKFKIHQLGEPKFGSFTIRLLPSVLKILILNRPKYIFVREEYIAFIISFFFKNVIYEIHDVDRKKIFIYKNIIRNSLITIATSSGILETLKKESVNEDKIVVLGSGFDKSLFDGKININTVRKQLKLPLKKKIVTYSGRLSYRKGIYTLIDSLKYLSDDYVLTLVGGFEGEEDIVRKYIKKSNLNERVIICGFQHHSQIPLFLKASDILVIPNTAKEKFSQSFTSPIKLFEYMASQKPIIASNVESITNIVGTKCTILFKPDSPKNLAIKITELEKNHDKSKKLISNAFKKVLAYSWDERCKRIIKIMSSRKLI